MLSDLERSSQALVSRLESELMRDKRLLQQQETLNKNLQTKLDASDQKNFTYEKEIKVLKQKTEELVKMKQNLASSSSLQSHSGSNLTSGLSTLAPSGLTTPLALGQLTSSMPTMSDIPHGGLLDPEKQQKLQIERSKLIRYAKELRKRVADRDSKILNLSATLAELNSKIDTLQHESSQKIIESNDTIERLETEVKSLTNSISRANSETMHYKRDLENIKLEITTVSRLLLEGPNVADIEPTTDCLEHLVKTVAENFVRKSDLPAKADLADNGQNTDLNLTNFSQLTEVTQQTKQDIITPRMMYDMNETVSENESNRSHQKNLSPVKNLQMTRSQTEPISQPIETPIGIHSRQNSEIADLNSVGLPRLQLKVPPTNDNPSLTQDINEIFRIEEAEKIAQRSNSVTTTSSGTVSAESSDVINDENIGPSGPGQLPLSARSRNKKPKILRQVNQQMSQSMHNLQDVSRIFDPNRSLTILEEMNRKEDEELTKLDNLLQSHIDNFLAETAELF